MYKSIHINIYLCVYMYIYMYKTVKNQRWRETPQSCKRKKVHDTEGDAPEAMRGFLSRNLPGWERVGYHDEGEKKCQPRILHSAEVYFRSGEEIKSFPDKQKLNAFITTRPVFKGGLPWQSSGWKSICQCRRHGLDPWSGKTPHVTAQLSLYATTTELTHHSCWSPGALEPMLHNQRNHGNEKPTHCN